MQNQLAVLIVEDDPATQANLRDILELDSCLIELAGSIRQVTEHDHLEKFAIILLDRLLPDGDGLLLLPFLRDNTPATDVILITGHADLEGAIAALRHNVADFLIKPVQPELLRHQLSRIREQHRLQDHKERHALDMHGMLERNRQTDEEKRQLDEEPAAPEDAGRIAVVGDGASSRKPGRWAKVSGHFQPSSYQAARRACREFSLRW